MDNWDEKANEIAKVVSECEMIGEGHGQCFPEEHIAQALREAVVPLEKEIETLKQQMEVDRDECSSEGCHYKYEAVNELKSQLAAKDAQIGEQNDALMRYQDSQEALEAELAELKSEPIHKLLSKMKERAEKAESLCSRQAEEIERLRESKSC